MAFFDRFKKSADKKGVRPAQPTGWENMEPSQEVDADAERQKRKILGAYALGINALSEHDVKMGADTRQDVIESLASGQVSDEKKRDILEHIQDPVQANGADNVLSAINSKHEKRILAAMGVAGFDNYENVSTADIRAFIGQYPTPMDFQAVADKFLQQVEQYNGPEKRAEYEAAMTSFLHKIYGKKQEYWERMRELDKEADQVRERHEVERSAEWIPGDAAVTQTSRNQAQNGIISRANIDSGLRANISCEDSYYFEQNRQIYGVFDGAGGVAGGRLASQMTASVLHEYCSKYAMKDCSSLASALEDANVRVANEPNAGASTATVATVFNRNGRVMLGFAQVGDSRIYIVDAKGKARLITKDEGVGRIITNAVGHINEDGSPIVKQFGEINLHKGDRVVICSDGITGDYGDDLMSEEELGRIVSASHGAEDASRNLVAAARKKDDRTALVFVPDFDKA